MGRGSASAARKSNESAAVSGIASAFKKKADTWEAPKGVPLITTIDDDLAQVSRDLERRARGHIMIAENSVARVHGVVMEALLRLTEPVKQMKVKDYVRNYGGNLRNFVEYEAHRVKSITSHRAADAQTKRMSARKAISQIATSRSHRREVDLNSSGAEAYSAVSHAIPSTPAHGTSMTAASKLLTIQAKKTPGGSQTDILTLHLGDEDLDLDSIPAQLDPATMETAANRLELIEAKIQAIKKSILDAGKM